MTQHRHAGFLAKMLMWCTWILAGVVFFSVGFSAMAPTDPHGPVSLLARNNAGAMFLQAVGLCAVTAAVATLLVGRLLPDAGTFAAAVGLVSVSVRGSTAAWFLVQGAETGGSPGRVGIMLALDALAWFGVIVVALAVSTGVSRWILRQAATDGGHHATQLLAGVDLLRRSPHARGTGPSYVTPPYRGARHTVITAVVASVAFLGFSTGLATRSIQHGQACFVVAASACTACYVAHRLAPVSSALWSLLGVALLPLIGYTWAVFHATGGNLPPTIPASPFLRVLPIQYVAMGTAASVAMCWYMRDPDYIHTHVDATRAEKGATQRAR